MGRLLLHLLAISTTAGTDFTGDVVTVKVPRALASDGRIFVRLHAILP